MDVCALLQQAFTVVSLYQGVTERAGLVSNIRTCSSEQGDAGSPAQASVATLKVQILFSQFLAPC